MDRFTLALRRARLQTKLYPRREHAAANAHAFTNRHNLRCLPPPPPTNSRLSGQRASCEKHGKHAHTERKARDSRERFRNLQAKADENRNKTSTGALCSLRPLLFLSAAATAADADVVDGEENEDADAQNDGRANPDNDRLW